MIINRHFILPLQALSVCLLLNSHLRAHEDHTHHENHADHADPELPKFTSASQWIAYGNSEMQNARNTLSHDFRLAEKAFKKAYGLEPKNVEAVLGLAWVANSNHDFEQGVRWAEQALELNPNAKDAFALLGDVAVEMGKYDEAIEHFQDALDVRADLSTYSRAAHVLWLTGNTNQAHHLMRQAIKSGGPYPENEAWCRAELAMMLLKTGSLPSARQEAEAALSLAPKNPRVLVAMGRVFQYEGKYKEAIESFEASVSVTLTHDALAPLATLYRLTGKDVQAEKQVEKVVQFHTGSANHHHGAESHSHGEGHSHASSQLALFLAENDTQLPLALSQAKEAYKAFPNIYAADALAWCHYQAGDFKQAQRSISRALRHGTPDPKLYFHAGMIAQAEGRENDSRKLISKALSLSPNFDPIDAGEARKVLASTRIRSANEKREE